MARGAKRAAVEAGPVEGPWELPVGWRWERLGDVGMWGSGGTPAAKSSAFYGGGIPWVRSGELRGRIIYKTELTLTEEGVRASSAKWVPKGALLVAMYGANIGQAALAGIDCTTNQAVAHCIPSGDNSAGYLFHFVSFIRDELRRLGQGGAQPNISQTILKDYPVPIPSPDMQRRIVARIEELLDEIAEGEDAASAADDCVAVYNRSLLQAAITGKLTAEWRATQRQQHGGEAVMAAIRQERAGAQPQTAKRGRKHIPSDAQPNPTTDLPEGWVWASLDDLSTEPSRNGLSVKEAALETQVRALRLDALSGDQVDWSRSRYLPRTLEQVKQYRLAEGDLLVSRANGSPRLVGKAALCAAPPTDMIFPDTAIRYRIGGGATVASWVLHAWNSPLCRSQIERAAKTTAGILKISQEDIRSILLPVPSSEEMEEIVRLLASLIAQAQPAAAYVADLVGVSGSLRQSILAAAFRGDLVA